MNKPRLTAGKIYEVGDHYGLALYHEQKKYMAEGKIFLHLFTDMNCTQRKICPKTNRPMVAIKTRQDIRLMGFND